MVNILSNEAKSWRCGGEGVRIQVVIGFFMEMGGGGGVGGGS